MPETKVIAIAGNPNVGKSTLFNSLTGMNQHTGNWPGKTVTSAQGHVNTAVHRCLLVDIPGTYSLMAHSAEEEVARNFLCFGESDATVIVCDATCLERSLNLVLQVLELSGRALVCVNLMDEAERKQIHIDLKKLERLLGVPVAGTVARKKRSLRVFLNRLDEVLDSDGGFPDVAGYAAALTDSDSFSAAVTFSPAVPSVPVSYGPEIEEAASVLCPVLAAWLKTLKRGAGKTSMLFPNPRFFTLKLLEGDESLIAEMNRFFRKNPLEDNAVKSAYERALACLADHHISPEDFRDRLVSSLVDSAEGIAKETVTFENRCYSEKDRKLDRLFTSRLTGYPVMAALLALIFWLTIAGANYPSRLLSTLLFQFQNVLSNGFLTLGTPLWLHDMVILGMYRTLAWVISVMLPPMAIFFPLFTLLEDSGYLPRIAFNLDKPFQCCHSCGKQALTMCMGFGCNAAGITGCRIIDSPRERLIAMLTNSFVPCNGRFPIMISIISLFFVGNAGGPGASLLSSLFLTLFIIAGILMTFLASRLLSATLLKGVPSSFTLELPPYRRPQLGRIVWRSVFDRTVFVLGRAAAVAAPAGLVIWLMANIAPGQVSLLTRSAAFLDPFGRLLGLDGVILMAFVLGLPANEIVLPIILMAYLSQGQLTEYTANLQLKEVLVSNGWTTLTAVNLLLFTLMHWPCSTTLLTIKKESGGLKWCAAAFLLPTLCGVSICILLTAAVRFLA